MDVIAVPVMLHVQRVVVVALLEHTQQANQMILTKVGHVRILTLVVQPLLPIVIVPVAVHLGLLQIVIQGLLNQHQHLYPHSTLFQQAKLITTLLKVLVVTETMEVHHLTVIQLRVVTIELVIVQFVLPRHVPRRIPPTEILCNMIHILIIKGKYQII